MKFTETNVKKIKPPAAKADHWEPDDKTPGFGIRFRNGGAGIYGIRYGIGGRDRRLAFQPVSKVKLADARAWARRQFVEIGEGVDPAVERAKAAVQNGVHIPDLVDAFVEEMSRNGRSQDYIERTKQYLNGTERSPYFRPLHKIPLAQIDRATVGEHIECIVKENGKIAASRGRAALSVFFGWAIAEAKYGVEYNPVENTKKYQSRKRDHFLEPEEIVAVWNACGDDDYGDIVRLLILTAARRDQIGQLDRKTELKLDQSDVPVLDRLISLPARVGRSKNKERFLIPLSKQAIAILQKRKAREGSDFVFGEGAGGFSGWSKCKTALDERLGDKVRPWVLHDLRRTFDRLGQDVCKIPPHIADALLNHVGVARSGVRGHYNFAEYLDDKREAMQKWGDYVVSLIRDKGAGSVPNTRPTHDQRPGTDH
ncbi:site-specific integrase [Bradyrhizobium sp. CB82]|uniref:tyrosine-type recombinase/integrase n=1 Tax=Bradyrhizobium sp. CB82 TaxID=3039159 RepID=UPI0024B27E5E|nr:site-specific integrase [Bradyrhizobium sp. CB82]WFU37601.1 site-specific integrase [Bradyrhizobium sp. CB82]